MRSVAKRLQDLEMPVEDEPEIPEETGGHPECTSGADCLGTPTDRLVRAPRCVETGLNQYKSLDLEVPEVDSSHFRL